MNSKKVFITGGCGICGTALVDLTHETLFFDCAEKHPLLKDKPFIQGNIADKEQLRKAMQGYDVLVHLAGCSDSRKSDAQTQQKIMQDNINGTRAAFEVAAEVGIEHIVYASSSHVVGMFEKENAPGIYLPGHTYGVVDKLAPCRPDSLYGVSKVFGENFGRFLAEQGGPRFSAVRIGSVRAAEEDHPYAYAEWGVRKGLWTRGSDEYAVQENRLKALWQSRRDFLQLISLVVKYEGAQFDIFYGVSDNDRGWLDISYAKRVLGYKPQDNSEGWVEVMTRQQRDAQGEVASSLRPQDLEVVSIISIRQEEVDREERLIQCAIHSAKEAQYIDKIVVATDRAGYESYYTEMGVDTVIVRPAELSLPDVRVDMVLQFALQQLEQQRYTPDIVVPIEVICPFRPPHLLDTLIERLVKDSFDTVIAGYQEFRPSWKKKGEAMIRIDEYAKLRSNREPVHVGLPSLGCATYAEFIRKGSRLGARVGLVEIVDQLSRIEIRTEEDLHYLNMFTGQFAVSGEASL